MKGGSTSSSKLELQTEQFFLSSTLVDATDNVMSPQYILGGVGEICGQNDNIMQFLTPQMDWRGVD